MKKARIQQKADFARRGKINSFNMAKKRSGRCSILFRSGGQGCWMNIPTVPWTEKEKL